MDPTQNKYSVYRDIRAKRTYRTIGKMSWWRIVLGVILIIVVLFISGFVSQLFAARENFYLAEKLMIYPEWMERYKPETKAFIEAGVVFQDGDYLAAAEAFGEIEKVDAAAQMESRAYLMHASDVYESGNNDEAYDALLKVDPDQLSPEDVESLNDLAFSLLEIYEGQNTDKADALRALYVMMS